MQNAQNIAKQNNNYKSTDMKFPLNQILYGPPGTGKTYNAIPKALAILGEDMAELKDDREQQLKLFNEYKQFGQIEMLTFHQNFSYEDFIEGIKPALDNEDGGISYKLEDGIFKTIADRAKNNLQKTTANSDDNIDIEQLIVDFADDVRQTLEKEEKIYLGTNGASQEVVDVIFETNENLRSFVVGGSIKSHQRLNKKIIIRDLQNFIDGNIGSYKEIKPTYDSKQGNHGNARYYFKLYQDIKAFYDTSLAGYSQRVENNVDIIKLITYFADYVSQLLHKDETVYFEESSSKEFIAVKFKPNGDFRSFVIGGGIKDQSLTADIIIRDLPSFLEGKIKKSKILSLAQTESLKEKIMVILIIILGYTKI